ncbi:MAG TPA: glycosyl hydrolase family 28-related protein [Chitinophagales bacterium]|nr:glycosyl hydrolase family 28-related protein [Chitinophagales bacterium]HRK28013.1 glycosyl hydrolase family 28-related protein [Chitinophagales bacterium]
MKKVCSALIFYFCWIQLCGQVIPQNRQVEWYLAGLDYLLPNPPTVVNVLDYGATGNATTNDSPAVAAAIAALGGVAGVVYFPAGNYRLTGTITLPSGVVLRGESAQTARLLFDQPSSGTYGINVSGSATGSFTPVVSGFTKGSTAITVSDATAFTVGSYAELLEDNNPAWDTNPATWAANSKGQIVKISGKGEGNTLLLAYPLRIDYDATFSPRIRPINPATNAGIECLYVERLADSNTGAGYNISFNFATNCWVKGIHSNKSVGAHISITASTDIEVTGCYIHHAFTYDGSGTRGYGVMLNHHSGQCLVANNVFERLRHAMSVKQGANGNVLAYNYAFDGYRSEFPNNFAADINLHGHYAYANLFEGNICELFWIDDYWGPSGPYNTIFRNRFTTYGIYMTSSGSNMQHFVGNEVTSTAFLQGFYTITGSNHIQHGNNIKGTITPSGTGTLADVSYYLTQPPDFWNITGVLPTIGIPNPLNSGTNPARARFVAGEQTVCPLHIPPVRVRAQAFLQGAYTGAGAMHNILRANNLLPLQQPFNQAPWNYAGTESLNSLTDIPANTTDWVLLEVRHPANPTQVVERRAAFLLQNGDIVDIDNSPDGVLFTSLAPNAPYHLCLKTRNHLPVISAAPLLLPNAAPFNFGNPAVVNMGAQQLVNMGAGYHALWAADINANGVINVHDFTMYATQFAAPAQPYLSADCNLDGVVNLQDFTLFRQNAGIIGVNEVR